MNPSLDRHGVKITIPDYSRPPGFSSFTHDGHRALKSHHTPPWLNRRCRAFDIANRKPIDCGGGHIIKASKAPARFMSLEFDHFIHNRGLSHNLFDHWGSMMLPGGRIALHSSPYSHSYQQAASLAKDLGLEMLSHPGDRSVYAPGAFWYLWAEPITSDTRHSFRGWTQALDGIIQNVMGLPPLLDGHKDQQDRVANPNLQWLRDIILAAKSGDIGKDLNTGQFLRIAEDAGIEFPGNQFSKAEPAIRAGRILVKLFRDTEGQSILVDGFTFSRNEAPDYSTNADGGIRKFYTIAKA